MLILLLISLFNSRVRASFLFQSTTMRTWRRFKKLFQRSSSPKMELIAQESRSPPIVNHNVNLKELRAARVIESEYMLYDSILRRRTLLGEAEERASTVVVAIPPHFKDLSVLPRSSERARGLGTNSPLTIITFGEHHNLYLWDVIKGIKLCVLEAFPSPVHPVSPSLQFSFLISVDEEIMAHLLGSFGSSIGTRFLVHNWTARSSAQPLLLECTNSEGEDNSTTGVDLDTDIHNTHTPSCELAKFRSEIVALRADMARELARKDEEIAVLYEKIKQSEMLAKLLLSRAEIAELRLKELEHELNGNAPHLTLLAEQDNAVSSIEEGSSGVTETGECLTPEVSSKYSRHDKIDFGPSIIQTISESANGQLDQAVPTMELVPFSEADQTKSIVPARTHEECFEIMRMRNELNKGCTLHLKAGQDSFLILKDISMPSDNAKGAKSASICSISAVRSELETRRSGIIEEILQKEEDLAKLKAKMKRGTEMEASCFEAAESEALDLRNMLKTLTKQLRTINSIYFMNKASTSSAPQIVNHKLPFTLHKEESDIIFIDEIGTPSKLFTSFEARCPPGGQESIILYTTTLHIVRKTFEDCSQIRSLLKNSGINFIERDISLDLGHKQEFMDVLGFRAIPPGLFIKGKYIGGAEEAIGLHESGELKLMADYMGAEEAFVIPSEIDVIQAKCPPADQDSVILYTTSLHTIRKTFEDCNQIRSLLSNLGVNFRERDISMDLSYKKELMEVFGYDATLPKLFIKGRYIGGSEEVIRLNEIGKLKEMMWQFIIGEEKRGLACEECGGFRFTICSVCDGSHKIYDENEKITVSCLVCNENGLVKCLLCS